LNKDFPFNLPTSAGMDTKPLVSRRFAIGDKVEYCDLVRGGMCTIAGTVVNVIDRGDMQAVFVEGETKSGIKVNGATYTDDSSLKLVQTFG
jgi:hypothetical protein